MFALAVLLLVAAAALVLWVLFGLNGEHNNDVHFHGFGIDANLSPLTVFLLGALTLLLIWAATRLITSGTKRKYRNHKENKELKRDHERQEEERIRLQKERDDALAAREREQNDRSVAESRQRVAENDLRDHDSSRQGEYVRGNEAVDPRRVDGSDAREEGVTERHGRRFRD